VQLATVVALFCGVACTNGDRDDASASPSLPSGGPTYVSIPALGLQLRLPGELADLTYAIGMFEAEQPTLLFSTETLAAIGGESCAAGAGGAVSPYPIGQIVVSTETPDQVRREKKANPAEDPGSFVTAVDDRYIYYIPPPEEGCAPGNPAANALQDKLTRVLRQALPSVIDIR
jgi:hypothetical protein